MDSILNKQLFLCVPWNNSKHSVTAKGLTIIVSDVIYGNNTHSAIQIHLAIKRRNRIVKLSDLSHLKKYCSYTDMLMLFESSIKKSLSQIVKWNANSPDTGIIKLWYYRPEYDVTRNDGLKLYSDLYLRVAITIINVLPLSAEDEHNIQLVLKECLTAFLED